MTELLLPGVVWIMLRQIFGRQPKVDSRVFFIFPPPSDRYPSFFYRSSFTAIGHKSHLQKVAKTRSFLHRSFVRLRSTFFLSLRFSLDHLSPGRTEISFSRSTYETDAIPSKSLSQRNNAEHLFLFFPLFSFEHFTRFLIPLCVSSISQLPCLENL